jgi:hypothetical protein
MSTTSVINSVVPSDVINNSLFVVVFLLFILALKVIVSSESHQSTKISNFNTSLNMVIFPLLLILLFLVAYMAKVITSYST